MKVASRERAVSQRSVSLPLVLALTSISFFMVSLDALVVVTELVNNAVTHAHGPCELRISSGPRALRVEVADRGAGTPEPLLPSATRNHGRGLHLVDALTAAWGIEPSADGRKVVWAELLR